MRRIQKLTLLTALYLAQGLPYGFFTQALPVLLRTANLSLPQIGLANLLTLPWALKFIWAPAVDRYHFQNLGLRKSWLVPIQGLSILLYLALGFLTLGEIELSLILAAFLLTNLLAASQDVATDGLAVDILAPKERGWGNAVQVAGYRIGMIIGGGALLALYPQIGWSGIMFAMAGFAVICTLPVLSYREPLMLREDRLARLDRRKGNGLKEIFQFFTTPTAFAWLSVLLLYKFGHASASFILRPWLVDQGYQAKDIAEILGTGAFAAGFAGAMSGGWLAAKFPRTKLLVVLGIIQLFAVTSYLWPVLSAPAIYKVLISASLDHFTSGLATTVLFTLMMNACSPNRAASDYTAQACVVVVSQGLAALLGGYSAQALGYEMHFALSALVGLIAVLVTAFVVTRSNIKSFLTPQAGRLTAMIALAAIALTLLAPAPARAQNSDSRDYEFSGQGGAYLPGRKIKYVREIMEGVALRGSMPLKSAHLELATFLSKGYGDQVQILDLDYSVVVWDDFFPTHASFGMHMDRLVPEGKPTRQSLGWHFGAGMKQPIANGFAFREDFRYRAGGGFSLLVLIGVSYEL